MENHIDDTRVTWKSIDLRGKLLQAKELADRPAKVKRISQLRFELDSRRIQARFDMIREVVRRFG